MKIAFRFLLPLIVISTTIAQKKVVYQETISTSDISTLTLNSKKTFIQVKSSSDNNIHINFSIEFFNHKKKEVDRILEEINTEELKRDKNYIFSVSSKDKLGRVVYQIDSEFGLFLDDKTFESGDGKKRRFRKTKDDLAQLITHKAQQEKMLLMLKKYNESGELEDINLEDEKSFRVSFIVEVPSHIDLKINLVEADLDILNNITQPLQLLAKKSNVSTLNLNNKKNKISLKDGTFKTMNINNGTYKFDGLTKVIIAEISDALIESEFSDISIGEMTSPIEIRDFNSEFWFYDLVPSLEQYHFFGEYSKINVYYPTNDVDYKVSTIGFNTAHYLENMRTDIPPNRENKMTKMLVAQKDNSETERFVDFEIEIKHGIVRFGRDFIEIR